MHQPKNILRLFLFCTLFMLTQSKLMFSAVDADSGNFIPYFKEKFGKNDVSEDSFTTSPFAIAVADGLGGCDFHAGYIANYLTNKFVESSITNSDLFFGLDLQEIQAKVSSDIDQIIKIYEGKVNEGVYQWTRATKRKPNYKVVNTVSASATFVATVITETEAGPILKVFQRGDSLCVVFRPVQNPIKKDQYYYKPVYITEEKQHSFNAPHSYNSNSNNPKKYLFVDFFQVQAKDIVIIGSDGFFDNMHIGFLAYIINYLASISDDGMNESRAMHHLTSLLELFVGNIEELSTWSNIKPNAQKIIRKNIAFAVEQAAKESVNKNRILSKVSSKKRRILGKDKDAGDNSGQGSDVQEIPLQNNDQNQKLPEEYKAKSHLLIDLPEKSSYNIPEQQDAIKKQRKIPIKLDTKQYSRIIAENMNAIAKQNGPESGNIMNLRPLKAPRGSSLEVPAQKYILNSRKASSESPGTPQVRVKVDSITEEHMAERKKDPQIDNLLNDFSNLMKKPQIKEFIISQNQKKNLKIPANLINFNSNADASVDINEPFLNPKKVVVMNQNSKRSEGSTPDRRRDFSSDLDNKNGDNLFVDANDPLVKYANDIYKPSPSNIINFYNPSIQIPNTDKQQANFINLGQDYNEERNIHDAEGIIQPKIMPRLNMVHPKTPILLESASQDQIANGIKYQSGSQEILEEYDSAKELVQATNNLKMAKSKNANIGLTNPTTDTNNAPRYRPNVLVKSQASNNRAKSISSKVNDDIERDLRLQELNLDRPDLLKNWGDLLKEDQKVFTAKKAIGFLDSLEQNHLKEKAPSTPKKSKKSNDDEDVQIQDGPRKEMYNTEIDEQLVNNPDYFRRDKRARSPLKLDELKENFRKKYILPSNGIPKDARNDKSLNGSNDVFEDLSVQYQPKIFTNLVTPEKSNSNIQQNNKIGSMKPASITIQGDNADSDILERIKNVSGEIKAIKDKIAEIPKATNKFEMQRDLDNLYRKFEQRQQELKSLETELDANIELVKNRIENSKRNSRPKSQDFKLFSKYNNIQNDSALKLNKPIDRRSKSDLNGSNINEIFGRIENNFSLHDKLMVDIDSAQQSANLMNTENKIQNTRTNMDEQIKIASKINESFDELIEHLENENNQRISKKSDVPEGDKPSMLDVLVNDQKQRDIKSGIRTRSQIAQEKLGEDTEKYEESKLPESENADNKKVGQFTIRKHKFNTKNWMTLENIGEESNQIEFKGPEISPNVYSLIEQQKHKQNDHIEKPLITIGDLDDESTTQENQKSQQELLDQAYRNRPLSIYAQNAKQLHPQVIENQKPKINQPTDQNIQKSQEEILAELAKNRPLSIFANKQRNPKIIESRNANIKQESKSDPLGFVPAEGQVESTKNPRKRQRKNEGHKRNASNQSRDSNNSELIEQVEDETHKARVRPMKYRRALKFFTDCSFKDIYEGPAEIGASDNILPLCIEKRLRKGFDFTLDEVARFSANYDPKKVSKILADVTKNLSKRPDYLCTFYVNAVNQKVYNMPPGGKSDDIAIIADIVVDKEVNLESTLKNIQKTIQSRLIEVNKKLENDVGLFLSYSDA